MAFYFKTFDDTKVKGQRHLFVLNHSYMSKLLPFSISSPFGPVERFPHGHSLFMQCNNFLQGKTHGYLVAVKIDDVWRLGVFQHSIIKEKSRKIGYVAVFDEGTVWPLICQAMNTCRRNGIKNLLSYMSGEMLENPLVIPLAEVSRRDTLESETVHSHRAESGEYFEQPKYPDIFHTLSNKNFQKLFHEPKICNYDIGMLVREGFFMKKRMNLEPHRRIGQDRKRDATSVADSISFNLITETAKTSWKLIDRDDVDENFHVYYVQYLESDVHEGDSKEKHFLLPVIHNNGSYSDNGAITFYNMPSKKDTKEKMMGCDYMPIDEYNSKCLSMSKSEKTSLLLINPVTHRRGFVFSILPPGQKTTIGTEVFRNRKLIIYHHEQDSVMVDSDLDGVVVFRGFPWYFDTSKLNEDSIKCLETMHHTPSGMLDSRKKVDMVGYFSYTGPRATSQSSRSPTEPSVTKGHDIYNRNYCPLTYPLGVRLGRSLCRQSDEILQGSGNVMMKAAVIAKNHLIHEKEKDNENMRGHCSQMKYENICHNRIITMWFGSTLHRDDNDLVNEDIKRLFDASCKQYSTCGKVLSDKERNVLEYFQRARFLYHDEISMSTICCWKALETSSRAIKEEPCSHNIHFFCCESLGFALDISSACLLNKDLSGAPYGGSFSSRIINHGTSIPLSTNMSNDDVHISLKPQSNCYIPFAWGRTGGPAQ